jgi:pyrroloquinoline quinone (PQQ) biosynthesis protein C
MATGDGKNGETLEVYSDGCVLCRETLGNVQQEAAWSGAKVLERRVDDVGLAGLVRAGVRATPSLVADGVTLGVGRLDREQALSLVKRARLNHVVLEYAIPKSDAIQRFAAGKAPNERVARALATEFYAFSHEFPLFLAAAISFVKDEAARLLLVHNLYEEHGNLEMGRVHPALFRQFVRGIGLQPEALERLSSGSAGVEAARYVTSICREGPGHRALGALYVTELLFGPACEAIMAGLKQINLSAHATEFFSLHAVAEEHHKEQIWQALERICRDDEELREAIEVAADVARMFYNLFDYIARSSFVTTSEEMAVYEGVRRICEESPQGRRHPVRYRDAAYYFGIHAGEADQWFLRAFCDSDRRSLVTRLPLDRARSLAGKREVEEVPAVFGSSRVYFDGPKDLDELRPLILGAFEDVARRMEKTAPRA